MTPPRIVKEVQRLTGRLTALNIFITRLGNEACHFSKFWGIPSTSSGHPNVKDPLKVCLSSLNVLSQPSKGETFFLYLGVVDRAIGLILVREVKGVQSSIYYIGKTLLDVETRYLKIEKVALAFMTSSRKLKAYFQAHQVMLLIDQPLRQILHKPDMSGWLLKWEIELGEYRLQYRLRPAIKGQALANFIAECKFEEAVTEDLPPNPKLIESKSLK